MFNLPCHDTKQEEIDRNVVFYQYSKNLAIDG